MKRSTLFQAKAAFIKRTATACGFLLLIAAMLFAATPLKADTDSGQDPETFFKTRLDAVIDALGRKDLDQENRRQKVVDIILPAFDFHLMAQLSLGKRHWSALPEEQQQRFSELFIQKLRNSYLDTMLQYTDERIAYKPSVIQGGRVHIPTELISKTSVYSMVYKLWATGGSWKVYDIEIEGVSIIKSYRTQFDSILRSGTMDDLLIKLESPDEIK